MSTKPGIVILLIGTYASIAIGLSSVASQSPPAFLSQDVRNLTAALRGPLVQSGLPNLYRLNDRLFAGGQPDGVIGFHSLATLGVHTVISVDGAEPDVEAASQAGLRYVHLPIGYDGIARSRLVELYMAVHHLPEKVYIHCHQGLHRGPAVAVAVCQMEGALAPGAAGRLMQEMGTASKYLGLYRDAQAALPATLDEEKSIDVANLPSRTSVPPLTHQMVELNHAFVDWSKNVKNTDVWTLPLQSEATNLGELLFEAGRRLDDIPQNDELRQLLISDGHWLINAAEFAEESPSQLTNQIRTRCDHCHARFRDR